MKTWSIVLLRGRLQQSYIVGDATLPRFGPAAWSERDTHQAPLLDHRGLSAFVASSLDPAHDHLFRTNIDDYRVEQLSHWLRICVQRHGVPMQLQASATTTPDADELHQHPGCCCHDFRGAAHPVLPQELDLELHAGKAVFIYSITRKAGFARFTKVETRFGLRAV